MKVEEFMNLPLKEILRRADSININRRRSSTEYKTKVFLEDAAVSVEWTARNHDDIMLSEEITQKLTGFKTDE